VRLGICSDIYHDSIVVNNKIDYIEAYIAAWIKPPQLERCAAVKLHKSTEGKKELRITRRDLKILLLLKSLIDMLWQRQLTAAIGEIKLLLH
jgi:hypothetical protein